MTPIDVHDRLARHILADGDELVLDLARSRGSRLIDARNGVEYLDLFTFFASSALGMNHPALVDDVDLQRELSLVATNKPSNSDFYSVPYARFVETFARVLGDPALPHLFFIDGGALAVENALKVAFDWKSRWNEAHGIDPALGTRVLHLEHAFHGRSGYTLSLTNTDPTKTARFPKFDWPRIPAPYLTADRDIETAELAAFAAARDAFERYPHDVACFIMEPIQGEGGDHHFRPSFLAGMAALCREFDALFVLDEVQTGVGLTGTTWAYQQLGVRPDVVAFGKKTQVCGLMAGGRVDEIPENVFTVSSRINSTWGGNLTDMVRARRIFEVVEAEGLVERAAKLGDHLLHGLEQLADRHDSMRDVRGRGLMCAFDLPDRAARNDILRRLRDERQLLALASGERGIRFRPALTISIDDLDEALTSLDRVLTS
ncbi:MAG: L-lysine 6-transaminase [Actinobacteria bacterium]|nr:L-lysine 6-transaminase [Actinomycetota bacterium]